MNLHEFVFSEKSPQRYIRHIVFWLAWWVYFLLSMNFLPAQTNAPQRTAYSIHSFPDIIHLALIVTIQMLACYGLIYFFLPRYLLRAKYFLFIAGLILLTFAMLIATRFIDVVVASRIRENQTYTIPPFYGSVFSGVISAIKIITVAVVIRLIKHWYFKQKEKERVEKEKIETELELLKAQIHPGFLFNTLNNIYSFALKPSPKAPEMLLKLSDILSYMLYECADKKVPLNKEIKLLIDYMSLEKIRYDKKLEMNMKVKGDTTNEKIAPLLLLRFIENSFKQCNSRMTEQPWINLEMELENHVLYMRLMNGKPPELELSEDLEEDDLVQAQRRLQLLYPGRHDLKISEEPEIMMVSLRIELEESSDPLATVKQEKVLETMEK